ncbi:hypothetical protein [Stratiformator vulcanicus]|uniref:Uncharacterized protein n=1 Tax=Stratiformator vulcanicus TaxID=2527980 RepID=A0A517R1C4_9PLAN|nr:hypothetical protein [Stratiformator vulcanicus]QDT37688.1 hypothetical protein Pan189_20700 [Stratiformator vulcanicus]
MPDDRTFRNAPSAGPEFEQARNGLPAEAEHEIDQDLATPAPEMHLRPGGHLEQSVHEELDSAARNNIQAARDRFADGIGEDGQPLDIEQVPGAALDYEAWLDRTADEMERNIRDRFNHANELERD